jgi:RTX calcium-binding nonapeptide repeat (4 copies)
MAIHASFETPGNHGDDGLDGTLNADQLFGGNGNDNINGHDGNDTLFGGPGDDTVVGGKGADTAFLGAGNDTFIWNPREGSDTVEGGAGFDTLDFHDDDISENITISANDSRALLSRTAGTVTMDLNGVERIQFEAVGQHIDHFTINDLTGTDVQQVAIDLGSGVAGGGDGQQDTVSIFATNGLASTVTISNFEVGIDQLSINSQTVTPINNQTVIIAGFRVADNNGVVTVSGSDNTSTASDGSHAANLALLGQHMASSFVAGGDGHGATPIADQPATQQPLLTQPHV